MNKSKKRNIIIGSLCAVVLLMAVGYAAFQTVLNIEGTSTISGNWDIKITNVTSKNIKGTASNNGDPTWENLTATFKTNLQSPGDSIEYDITVTNNGNLNAKLDKYKLTDTNNEVIKFTQTGLTNGEVLTAGSTKTFTVKVEYLSTTSEQPSKVTSALTITLDYSQAKNGYTPGDQTAAEQLTSNVVTSGDGLYEDAYESGRYIYRGSSPSNYITFNGEEWRVMAVEADGSLKLIKQVPLETKMAFDNASNRNPSTSTYCKDSEVYGCNAWSNTSNFINENQNGTVTTNSSLNTYLNNDYYLSLNEKSKDMIISYQYKYGAVDYNGLNIETTIKQENTYTSINKIGLINPSDYMNSTFNNKCSSMAQARISPYPCKESNYLYSHEYWYWTMNAYYGSTYIIYFIYSDGNIGNYTRNMEYLTSGSVRPVIHLKSDITLSGEGTKANPYIIS